MLYEQSQMMLLLLNSSKLMGKKVKLSTLYNCSTCPLMEKFPRCSQVLHTYLFIYAHTCILESFVSYWSGILKFLKHSQNPFFFFFKLEFPVLPLCSGSPGEWKPRGSEWMLYLQVIIRYGSFPLHVPLDVFIGVHNNFNCFGIWMAGLYHLRRHHRVLFVQCTYMTHPFHSQRHQGFMDL